MQEPPPPGAGGCGGHAPQHRPEREAGDEDDQALDARAARGGCGDAAAHAEPEGQREGIGQREEGAGQEVAAAARLASSRHGLAPRAQLRRADRLPGEAQEKTAAGHAEDEAE